MQAAALMRAKKIIVSDLSADFPSGNNWEGVLRPFRSRGGSMIDADTAALSMWRLLKDG